MNKHKTLHIGFFPKCSAKTQTSLTLTQFHSRNDLSPQTLTSITPSILYHRDPYESRHRFCLVTHRRFGHHRDPHEEPTERVLPLLHFKTITENPSLIKLNFFINTCNYSPSFLLHVNLINISCQFQH